MREQEIKNIGNLMNDISNKVVNTEEKQLQRLGFLDITLSEAHVINAITEVQQKTNSEVAQELELSPGTVTVIVNHLLKKGYVSRSRRDGDRRTVNLGLTKKGKKFYRVYRLYYYLMIQTAVEDLSDTEVQILSKSLKKINTFFGS
ncbi:MarR family winged helix-turn-helix transcriptional regulator [Bombilactobacillus bombi]|uniref:MarR family winged helix-turn-helix transcriptional regulator n=1 Tax=Bombilactobacillus bombi TaxID=1303590 RepID=UPI0035E6A702